MYGQPGFGTIPPAIKNLLLANIAIFLIQALIAPNLNDALIWLLPETYYKGIRNGYFTAFDLMAVRLLYVSARRLLAHLHEYVHSVDVWQQIRIHLGNP
jgi:hypothetical protein